MQKIGSEQRFDADKIKKELSNAPLFRSSGRVNNATGSVIRANGNYSIGEICQISRKGDNAVLAEVIGFEGENALLTPYGPITGISSYSSINSVMSQFEVPVGDAMTGLVVDALGQPIDGSALPRNLPRYPGNNSPPNPMLRPPIDTPFPLGVRALDGILTCGVGQRMGIFAAAGGGKSTLMSMLVRFAQYDRCIIALIGERGREVREFVEHQLTEEGLKKAVVVVATSDRPAIEQIKAVYTATALAEYHREQGRSVLLLVDSMTRFARAQRQIGLSAGEPPTRRGFPPSVFEKLPSIVERAGRSESGSITALYTVLVEGDDMNEPVADEVRSLLDGHIILSRDLAASGHYPAIDVLPSASRVLGNITGEKHRDDISTVRALLSKYKEVELLLRIGEYTEGSDRLADAAIRLKPKIDKFLRQKTNEFSSFDQTLELLSRAIV